MSDLPTKKELMNRITIHLKRRKDSAAVQLLWKGYLAALMEWGLLEMNDYEVLDQQLASVGEEELREIFLGFSDEYE